MGCASVRECPSKESLQPRLSSCPNSARNSSVGCGTAPAAASSLVARISAGRWRFLSCARTASGSARDGLPIGFFLQWRSFSLTSPLSRPTSGSPAAFASDSPGLLTEPSFGRRDAQRSLSSTRSVAQVSRSSKSVEVMQCGLGQRLHLSLRRGVCSARANALAYASLRAVSSLCGLAS